MGDEIPYGVLTFKWAALVEKFRLTPAQIGALTDYQIDALYFHARDKTGALVAPEGPPQPPAAPTKASQLATINLLEGTTIISPARAQELRDEVNRGESK
ncbi:hypothetical protein J8F10_13650 [Gemmata sp. G18]|uniref:Uncharacterized protein n=1 Tax=Gemmata palustris TaxID=2822762 RepID=A0ABS5BST2_9BACT|nr:hypothetical protein [Gemmata palustris]MBP3956330.1 hypothetical protein [Gemmata palustris]